jgi:hypothetical protein
MSDQPKPIIYGATDEICRGIGRVANEWAILESFVDIEIWQIVGSDNEACACITAHLQSLNRRLQALLALVRLRGGDEKLASALNRFIAKTDNLAKKRNRAVHDPWVSREDRNYRLEVTAERRLIMQFNRDSADRLESVRAEIETARNEFDIICADLQSLHASSQRTPP